MTENELVAILQNTLLWEIVCEKIEGLEQVRQVLQAAGVHMDIETASIVESEYFRAEIEKITDTELIIKYEMPFIIAINSNNYEAFATGTISIPAISHFEYSNYDFENMDKYELLDCKDIVRILRLNYSDVERIGDYG